MAETDRKLEQLHFAKVLKTFAAYEEHSNAIIDRKLESVKFVPSDMSKVIQKRLESHRIYIQRNAQFIKKLIEDNPVFIESVDDDSINSIPDMDHDKVRSTLRQFVRDWSLEGKVERENTYGPILRTLEAEFADVHVQDRGTIQVLCPGAGLGRLVYEIVKRGYSCQGNEFSFFMLLSSNFILNQVSHAESLAIYPWIHQFSNMPSQTIQCREVLIPDVAVVDTIPPTADFSMVGGDFIEVYSTESQKGKWDVVVTCFFMDTAKRITDYLQVISHCLKSGGIWINFGPLLYHFEGMKEHHSVEFTLEEFKLLISQYGFRVEIEETIDSVYAGCPESMMHYLYHNYTFKARKIE
ncbi:N2227-like protein-domain-containing protein [Globomyces pollinis-pini]|nr:N2227-like protein-domain-containing protein [Globomyces pollinis-pini]